MRIMVFFDLPTLTEKDTQAYRTFHKFLISNGFIMQQYSIYSKLVLNQSQASGVIKLLRKNTPSAGIVQCMTVTEKQYNSIEYLIGEKQTKVIDSDERWILL